jgi:hypothetical protein
MSHICTERAFQSLLNDGLLQAATCNAATENQTVSTVARCAIILPHTPVSEQITRHGPHLLLVKMKEKKLLKMQSLPKVLRSQAMRSTT